MSFNIRGALGRDGQRDMYRIARIVRNLGADIAALPRIHGVFARRKTPRTFPARWPLLALDRIWSRPPDLIESLHTPDGPVYRHASDHRPLLAAVRMLGIS